MTRPETGAQQLPYKPNSRPKPNEPSFSYGQLVSRKAQRLAPSLSTSAWLGSHMQTAATVPGPMRNQPEPVFPGSNAPHPTTQLAKHDTPALFLPHTACMQVGSSVHVVIRQLCANHEGRPIPVFSPSELSSSSSKDHLRATYLLVPATQTAASSQARPPRAATYSLHAVDTLYSSATVEASSTC